MPSRVIRESVNRSASLSTVSLEADFCFRALLVAVDDFGRCEAKLSGLKARVFPLRPEITIEVIQRCLQELESGDDPPLRRYVVDGRAYLLLTGWERHRSEGRRAKRSKYPDPPLEGFPANPRNPRIPRNPRNPPAGAGGGGGGGGGRRRAVTKTRKRASEGEPILPHEPPMFPPEFFEQLARENPLGGPVQAEVARERFAIVWPKMRERDVKRPRQAVVEWWSRVRADELEAARRRLGNRRLTEVAANAAHEPAPDVEAADVEALGAMLEAGRS